MSDINQNNVTDFSTYRQERLTWPYTHVTESQIKLEYEKIKKVVSDFKFMSLEISSSLSMDSYYVPGFLLYSWIFGWMIECLRKEYGIENRFYETDISLQYFQPVTKQILQQGLLRITYELVETIDQPEKSLVTLHFKVKIYSANGQILVQTSSGKFFTLVGPCPQIFISGEND